MKNYSDEVKNELKDDVSQEVKEEEKVEEEKSQKKGRARKNEGYTATVVGGDLNVRDEADGEAMFTIPMGSYVMVESENGNWAKIVGYVNKDYLK